VVEIDRRIRVASVYNRKRPKQAEIPGIAHAPRPRRVKRRKSCRESALPLSADSSRTALEVRFVPTSRHRQLIDHLVSAQQERSERVDDDVKCIRATTER
jgi:hypothetical protein